MKSIAIISEYNPFHNGHKYQIDETRNIFGNNINVISLMSGNFVQRGDLAIFDKHTRAKCAVFGGADLVLELPITFALSSAELFAKGSVSILNELNCVDYICFGSECGDIETLYKIANILLSDDFNNEVKENLKLGLSYPKTLDLTLSKIDSSFGEIIKNPNNTLGIEYIKALISSNSKIKPLTILRKNVDHHSEFENDNFASASYIRKNIDNNIFHLLPKNVTKELENKTPVSIKTIENSILSHLKRKDASFFANIADVSEGLEHKIVKSLKIATSLETLFDLIKSKRYTKSRIRRIILNSYLEIDKSYQKNMPRYAKVLAFNNKGRKILKNMREISHLPLILKPTLNYDLCEIGRKQFELDLLTTDLYSMAFSDKQERISGLELRKSPIFIDIEN